MEIETTLLKYGIISESDSFKEIARTLYELYLHKLSIPIEEQFRIPILTYQQNMFDFVDYLHTLEKEQIRKYLIYFDANDLAFIADLVFIFWCLPISDQNLSHAKYDREYASNIKEYLPMLIDLMDCYVLNNFCIESIINKKSVPVHCIDLVWHFLGGAEILIKFVNKFSKRFITIIPQEEVGSFELILNMEYLLSIGLGNVLLRLDDLEGKSDKLPPLFPRISFKDLAKEFLLNQELIDTMMKCNDTNSHNFFEQYSLIRKNPSKYFESTIIITTTMKKV